MDCQDYITEHRKIQNAEDEHRQADADILKEPVSMPSSLSAFVPMRLPGAPMIERLPPSAAAKTSGMRSFPREKSENAAMPMTTGISTAAVPVLDRKPLIRPVMSMTAMMHWRSVLAKRVTRLPILFAMPVSKSAWPTMNIATQCC